MINAELAVRAENEHSLNKLKNHMPEPEHEETKIAFNCECSDLTCEQRVLLTLKEYEKLHNKFSRFVIKKGHEEPKVEKVIASDKSMSIVEKYSLT